MVTVDEEVCPCCGGRLKHYDSVQRIVRSKGRKTRHIKIRRLRCLSCDTLHRELPDFLLPYKQYETEIIKGVLEGYITPETLYFEDYPCETTMHRWCSQKLQLLL